MVPIMYLHQSHFFITGFSNSLNEFISPARLDVVQVSVSLMFDSLTMLVLLTENLSHFCDRAQDRPILLSSQLISGVYIVTDSVRSDLWLSFTAKLDKVFESCWLDL